MPRSALRSARTRAPSACERWSGMNPFYFQCVGVGKPAKSVFRSATSQRCEASAISRKTSSGLPASQPELTFHRPGRSENRSRRWAGTVSDEPKLLGILHFAQRDHHGVAFYRVVLGERKVHAI